VKKTAIGAYNFSSLKFNKRILDIDKKKRCQLEYHGQ